VPDKIRDIFTRFDRVCFAGHTHDPGVITEEAQFIQPKECNHEFVFEKGRKYFVNIGSVGQPRDGDTRACYAVYHGDKVTWRRIEYGYRAAMETRVYTPQQEPRAGERLAHGR
jgi:diadenosine tetraphosphatase ApaH/serine/threonine PP2A family protein phosphatase